MPTKNIIQKKKPIKEINVIDLYVKVRDKYKKTDKNEKLLQKLKTLESAVIKRFQYIVEMKAAKYKKFHNHEDLLQEGMMALLNAMETYNPKKGSFFWWASQYVETKIHRQVPLHAAVRFPMAVLKKVTPYKESTMPVLESQEVTAERKIFLTQIFNQIESNNCKLTLEQQKIIALHFGLDYNTPLSIAHISENLQISRLHCLKQLTSGLKILRKNIKI